MPYTVWSRGRLLGHTDLGFIWREHGSRVGFFHPSESNQALVDIACGVGPASIAVRGSAGDPTAEADVAAAFDRRAALELELRDANEAVIPTEWIDVRDTELPWTAADGEDDDSVGDWMEDDISPELAADIEHDRALIEEWFANAPPDYSSSGDEPWQESPFPKYQIQVQLFDAAAIP